MFDIYDSRSGRLWLWSGAVNKFRINAKYLRSISINNHNVIRPQIWQCPPICWGENGLATFTVSYTKISLLCRCSRPNSYQSCVAMVFSGALSIPEHRCNEGEKKKKLALLLGDLFVAQLQLCPTQMSNVSNSSDRPMVSRVGGLDNQPSLPPVHCVDNDAWQKWKFIRNDKGKLSCAAQISSHKQAETAPCVPDFGSNSLLWYQFAKTTSSLPSESLYL